MSGSFLNVPQWAQVSWGPSPIMGGVPTGLPEDLEECDLAEIELAVDVFFNKKYPSFEPEIIHTMDKDYFLPALKVLVYYNGEYTSPGYEALWKDMELHAECRTAVAKPSQSGGGVIDWVLTPNGHESPNDTCGCGIYGSVHLEELNGYMKMHRPNLMMGMYPTFTIMDDAGSVWGESYASYRATVESPINKLCIIEPAPDAKVILCRKGWKASHAFISEIVGETIPVNVASNLLSIAWHRPVDVARLYENR